MNKERYCLRPIVGTAPGFQRHKYNGKELDRMFGLDCYDYGACRHDPVLLRFTSPDPLAEKAYGTIVYAYCLNNPVNAIDPDGRKTYLYATTLPGNNMKILEYATHTFIIVTDNFGRIRARFAYGSTIEGIKGAVTGQLVRQDYFQDKNVACGIDKKHIKHKIMVRPPQGVSSDEFDNEVIRVAESFGNNPNITYNFAPTSELQGNCNSSTSTILIKSGTSEKEMERIKNKIPGLSWGFSTKTAKPWTKEEQNTAVAKHKLQKKMSDMHSTNWKLF